MIFLNFFLNYFKLSFKTILLLFLALCNKEHKLKNTKYRGGLAENVREFQDIEYEYLL